MKIYIASDHAGYELKEKLKLYLHGPNQDVRDFGAYVNNPDDDYPDFVKPLAVAVATTSDSCGIVIGGSGEGEAICANRAPNVRACQFYGGNLDVVKVAREHNNANVLSLGARFITEEEARKAVDIFLTTAFSGDERHKRRIEKLDIL